MFDLQDNSQEPEKIKQTQVDPKDLILWTDVIRKSHPGSLSSLRKKHRDLIVDSFKTYCLNQYGQVFYSSDKNIVSIPEKIVPGFLTYLNKRIDEGLLDSKSTTASPAVNVKFPQDRKDTSKQAKEPTLVTIPRESKNKNSLNKRSNNELDQPKRQKHNNQNLVRYN